jgi:hypothetical protein
VTPIANQAAVVRLLGATPVPALGCTADVISWQRIELDVDNPALVKIWGSPN